MFGNFNHCCFCCGHPCTMLDVSLLSLVKIKYSVCVCVCVCVCEKNKKKIKIYFWLCCVFIAIHELSLVAASRGYSLLRCAGFSLWWLLLLRSTGSRHVGFSSCGTWARQLWLTGSRAQAQQLWSTGLVAPRHVGSSQTRARTCVPCVGRRILNHCATREVQNFYMFMNKIWTVKHHISEKKMICFLLHF